MGTLLAALAGFGIAFAEAGLGVGMLFPGEAALVVLAATHDDWHAHLMIGAAVTGGACLGDHVGYLLGRRFGPAFRESRLVRRIGQRHWDRATASLQRHGSSAVFLTKFVPIVRTLTPGAAGAARLAYGRFLPASAIGSLLWAAIYVGGGSLARTAANTDEGASQIAILIGGVGLVLAAPVLLVRWWLGRRQNRTTPATMAGMVPTSRSQWAGDRR